MQQGERRGDQPGWVVLRPGVPVVRREAGWLQVGLGDVAVVLEETAPVAGLVAALRRGRVRLPANGEERAAATRLWRAGLLLDAPEWERDRVAYPRIAAAAYARDPREAHGRLARRAAARVRVEGDEPWCRELSALLAANGLAETAGGSGDLHLLAVAWEPDRLLVDRLVQDQRPHLLIRGGPAELRVGPLVVPGRTACLRCEDAHRTDRDPRWPLLLAQLAARGSTAGVEQPAEPALVTLALASAVRDALTFVEGGMPVTWSATLTVDATLGHPRSKLLRHPHCGCAWDELLATG